MVNRRDVLVGLVFIGAIAAVGYLTVVIKGFSYLTRPGLEPLTITFDEVLSLEEGEEVRARGVKIGQVTKIAYDEDGRVDVEVTFFTEPTLYKNCSFHIRSKSPHPISSGETLFGLREFLPYFSQQTMDVAIVDAVWNGVWQSMKIAASAAAHEVTVAPHNFYGHLCTMMNAHFAAAVPHLRIMEIDIDRLPWDHELFTHLPPIEDGHLVIPARPGWGETRDFSHHLM